MNSKDTSATATGLADDDEIVDLDDSFFEQARIRRGGRVVREASGTIMRRGRPPKAVGTRKEAVSIRLTPEVLAHFRATGGGWQTRIDKVLLEHVRVRAGSTGDFDAWREGQVAAFSNNLESRWFARPAPEDLGNFTISATSENGVGSDPEAYRMGPIGTVFSAGAVVQVPGAVESSDRVRTQVGNEPIVRKGKTERRALTRTAAAKGSAGKDGMSAPHRRERKFGASAGGKVGTKQD